MAPDGSFVPFGASVDQTEARFRTTKLSRRLGWMSYASGKGYLPRRSASAGGPASPQCEMVQITPPYSEPRSNGCFEYSAGTDMSGSKSCASALRRPTARM
jgi:hypothetical protein